MEQKTTGIVISAKKQWWLKVNTKPIRAHTLDGAMFPYVITVEYVVDGTTYTKRKWVPVTTPLPALGSTVTVCYREDRPAKAKIEL